MFDVILNVLLLLFLGFGALVNAWDLIDEFRKPRAYRDRFGIVGNLIATLVFALAAMQVVRLMLLLH